MLPIRDINPTRRAPWVTYLLIAINVAVYAFQFLVLSDHQNDVFVKQHGVVPYFLFSGYGPALSTLVTTQFLHGSLGHLAGNMWFLHVFGDNVEDALGHFRYLIFYLLTGVVASVSHALMEPSSQMPLVGASGAISGVMGAYIVLFPHARVVAWAILFIVEVPAFVFLLLYFGMQIFSGFGTLGDGQAGVAFFAHIGGFVSGVALVLAAGRPKQPIAYLGPRVPTRSMRRR